MQFLTQELKFPPMEQVHSSGIIAFGGDLSVERLLLAYRNGIFPWFEDGEIITWWCPPKRMVVNPTEFKPSKSMRNILNRNLFKVTFNQCFKDVVILCQQTYRPGQDGTWITNEMIDAYTKLHILGHAQSVEVWLDNQLVGGLYGVDLKNVFCGESMFSLVSNASKVAFAALSEYLKSNQYLLLDCQVHNDHLESLGAFEISRETFLKILKC